jgi:hypothetical protein
MAVNEPDEVTGDGENDLDRQRDEKGIVDDQPGHSGVRHELLCLCQLG